MKPMSRPEIAGRIEAPEVTPVTTMPSTQNGQRLIQRKSILVVDDEPGVVAVLMEVFSEDGYRVDTAANGQEALKKLQELAFDVIMCDIRMPKMDGITFYRVIAQQEPYLLARWIFLTGDILNPRTHDFLQQVATAVLEKPFEIRKVREAVRRILQASERS
jgi:two-component system, cell cycle sensor histidine kinase and response regulator CckA